MIRSITITNYLNESMIIDMMSPEKSGLAVSNIDGLGPAEANISSSDLASSDGAIFNSARLSTRQLVFTLLLVPNEQIDEISNAEKVRRQIYKYFPIKKKATITFKTDEKEAYVTGYVETCEPTIFDQNTSVDVTVLCLDPHFYDISEMSTKFSGNVAAFSFPFSSIDTSIKFGSIITKTYNNIYYSGDSEVGILINMHAVGEVRNVKIYNTNTHESMIFNDDQIKALTGSTIVNGDDINISTIQGNKTIKLLRNGVEYNILNALNRDADWFTLSKGDNSFAFTADEDEISNPLNLIFTINSSIIYEGI